MLKDVILNAVDSRLSPGDDDFDIDHELRIFLKFSGLAPELDFHLIKSKHL
jgi:hypothetical protein